MKKDFIKEFWEGQAEKFGASHEASWGDSRMVQLELENIGNYIKPNQVVLDVGCANGYAAFHHLKKGIKKVVGIDFASKMIKEANVVVRKNKIKNASFKVGDIRKLDLPDNTFDLVYTTRVLINLPTWTEQMQGIKECIRVAKPGATILFSEAFWEPLVLLNSLRLLVGLPPLVEHDFNRYIKKSNMESFIGGLGSKYKVIDFSSVYYLGSRFVRELVTDPSKYPGYSNPINQIFFNIERDYSGGGMGVQQLYVVRKHK